MRAMVAAPSATRFTDRVSQNRRLLRKSSRTIEMDDERKRRVGGNLPGPAHDEFLSVWIEIPLAEGGGIESPVDCRRCAGWPATSPAR
jgi:hypothetical protein